MALLFNFVLLQLLASRKFNKTTLAEELIFRYFSDALSDRESVMKKWRSCHSKSSCSRYFVLSCGYKKEILANLTALSQLFFPLFGRQIGLKKEKN